jgi:chlorobactene glucosyltransferase
VWRARRSAWLDDETAPADGPTVSVVIPARDERENIGRCVRSVLAAEYAPLDVIVVDDQSTDGTAEEATRAAAGDPRQRGVRTTPLPAGWMGKQWACAAGAAAARGEVLCFTDADTEHAPDLLGRSVGAMRRRDAALFSVLGRQELPTFWERVAQPHVLVMMAGRYGGTEAITRSARVQDKLANGQFLLVRRDAYDALGGHAAVRASVSEDLVLAQRVFAAGGRVAVVLAPRQLSTRMYTSLGTLVRGWRKNVYAGGRETAPFGAAGRLLFPLMLLFPPLMTLAPPLLLLACWIGLAPASAAVGAAVAAAALLAFWAAVYRALGLPRRYALTYPLGGAVLLAIVVQALLAGRRVEWKGRAYVSE